MWPFGFTSIFLCWHELDKTSVVGCTSWCQPLKCSRYVAIHKLCWFCMFLLIDSRATVVPHMQQYMQPELIYKMSYPVYPMSHATVRPSISKFFSYSFWLLFFLLLSHLKPVQIFYWFHVQSSWIFPFTLTLQCDSNVINRIIHNLQAQDYAGWILKPCEWIRIIFGNSLDAKELIRDISWLLCSKPGVEVGEFNTRERAFLDRERNFYLPLSTRVGVVSKLDSAGSVHKLHWYYVFTDSVCVEVVAP